MQMYSLACKLSSKPVLTSHGAKICPWDVSSGSEGLGDPSTSVVLHESSACVAVALVEPGKASLSLTLGMGTAVRDVLTAGSSTRGARGEGSGMEGVVVARGDVGTVDGAFDLENHLDAHEAMLGIPITDG